MQWIGTVTRTDPEGRPYIKCRTLAGDSELGPLLSAQPRVTVDGAGLQSNGQPVTGAAVGKPVYLGGDTVLVSDVEGQLSTFVVVCRLV
jgi:hypothetical protein